MPLKNTTFGIKKYLAYVVGFIAIRNTTLFLIVMRFFFFFFLAKKR